MFAGLAGHGNIRVDQGQWRLCRRGFVRTSNRSAEHSPRALASTVPRSVTSAAHFRAAFEAFADSIHNVDAAGIHAHNFSKPPRLKRNRDVFPVEIPPQTWRRFGNK
jgi:microcystin degradation protein MlrC